MSHSGRTQRIDLHDAAKQAAQRIAGDATWLRLGFTPSVVGEFFQIISQINVALQGYGIPDLITFAWSTQQNQTHALSLEALRQKLQRQQFTAFELKLRDWRKGLVQAYRYRYFVSE